MRGREVVLTAVGIGLTLLFMQGGSLLGPMGAALNLLTPVAAAYLSMRFGLRAGIVVVAVVTLLLLQLAPVYTVAAYVGLFGVGSLLLPYLLQRQQSWDRAVLGAVSGAVLVTALLAGIAMLAGNIGPGQMLDQVIQSETEQAMSIYRQSGFSEDQLQELQGVIDTMAVTIRQSFYGLFIAGELVIQLLSLALLQRLKKQDYRIAGPAFAEWRLPAVLIWVLIVAGFALFIPFEPLSLIGRNLLTVLLPLYFLQGLAVVNSYLQRKAYPPVFKGVIFALLIILNPLPLIITGVGVFDLWIDFRRPRVKN